ncbi:hypothetical protein HLP44_000676 [Shigella sonnei]|nr:hypothetical protein [Shigella sonnei]
MEQSLPKKTLDEYINECLNKPPSDEFEPDGSSPRAVIERMRNKGVLSSVKWEIKESYRVIKETLYEFDGFNTPIGYFLFFITLPLWVFPFPLLRTYFRYKNAIKAYKKDYLCKYPGSQT